MDGRARSGVSDSLLATGVLLAALPALLGCSPAGTPRSSSAVRLGPTRGYILVSFDTLGAHHLGVYGCDRETSPFFDSLAARGALFEHAFVQYPSTLVSHVSMFTGLYPQEHGVYPPSSVLAEAIPTLPERFREHGYRTAGFTEGGFVSRDFGFQRGFDVFDDPNVESDTDVERTFARGVEFLRELDEDQPFFLFLHTYAVHDPYEPPEPWRALFWQGPPPEQDLRSDGSFLRDVNMGRREVSPEVLRYYRAMYDASVRYTDSVLESFIGELERLGLAAETTLILTSDHGEEFRQHGKLAHSQVYPETLRVPLLLLHPELRQGVRIAPLVQSVDLAPTLYALAGIPPPDRQSGNSLLPLIEGPSNQPSGFAYAEMFDQDHQRTWLEVREGSLYQYVASQPVAEPDGTWIPRRVAFDTTDPELALELVSYHQPRAVEVRVDGEPLTTIQVGTGWQPVTLRPPAPAPRHRFELASASCSVPFWLGLGEDTRCLGFKVRGVELTLRELFDLSEDPRAQRDISAARMELRRDLADRLAGRRWRRVAEPESRAPSAETREALEALGYL